MDPLSILGISASTVQFLDFGSRLLKALANTAENSSAYADLRTEAHRSVELAQAIERQTQHLGGDDEDQFRPPIESTILRECRRCISAGLDISVALEEDEKDPKQALEKISAAFRRVWNERHVSDMKSKLADARSGLMSRSVAPTANPPHQALAEDIRSADPAEASKPTSPYVMFTYHGFNAGNGGRQVQDGEFGLTDRGNADALLGSLHFDAYESRLRAIPQAYGSTFNWALSEPHRPDDISDQLMWSSLPSWMEGDSENVYWITGKPGSGKSTLMKDLVGRPQTLSHLERWSGGREVLVAAFCSWNAGNDLQKSQLGLLRTLLYQIVVKAPDMAPKLFPGRWAAQKIFGRAALEHLPEWSWEELFDSFTSLTALLKQRNDRRLAVFIDGLDEFSDDHSQLVELVKLFHSHVEVKVCVSSRPWNDFRDAFVSCPQLRMEDLTRNDLTTFVRGVSNANIAFQDLSKIHPAEAEDLVLRVVERAGGVFLWVALVTKALLNSLTDGATISELERLLDSLPDDLSNLYTHLWSRVKETYRRDGSRLLLLFRTYTNSPIIKLMAQEIVLPGRMGSEMLWLADGRKPEPANRIRQTLRRRLNSRTMGLLEVTSSHEVNYLHRTTKEWVDAEYEKLELAAAPNFDPHLGILQAISHSASPNQRNAMRNQFNSRILSQPQRLPPNAWGWALEAFYHAGRVTNDPDHRAVEALDRIHASFGEVLVGENSVTRQIRSGSGQINTTHLKFVNLAAELGVVSYVRATITAGPNYISIQDPKRNILACLLLGHNIDGFHSLLGFNSYVARNTLGEYAFGHIAFNPEGRYQLAKDILEMLCSNGPGKGKKIPTSVRRQLTPLATEITKRNRHNGAGWPKKELGQLLIMKTLDKTVGTNISAGGQVTPYGIATLGLLKSYGIRRSSGKRLEEWFAWKH
ncbi:hypothetical protein OQA88_1417 [Cercophora sp. LCS_1]